MNRRNFLGLAPVGVVGMVALAKGEPTESETEVRKAKTITIMGPNGEHYHPLVVEAKETQYANVELPKPIGLQSFTTHSLETEMMRISATGHMGLGTSTPSTLL